MDYGECQQCGRSLVLSRSGARFCSTKCRVYWHRAQGRIPARMTSGVRWVRAAGKRPIRVDGSPASSTDPSTWSTYRDVKRSTAGDGYGIMLGGGVGCYDLDHVTDEEAHAFLATVTEPIIFVERSISGDGVHVFVGADESKGWRRGGVEKYTRDRFIRVTGIPLPMPV